LSVATRTDSLSRPVEKLAATDERDYPLGVEVRQPMVSQHRNHASRSSAGAPDAPEALSGERARAPSQTSEYLIRDGHLEFELNIDLPLYSDSRQRFLTTFGSSMIGTDTGGRRAYWTDV